jgi:hypothetical protein
MAGLGRRIAAGLSERLASTWLLLSDTTNYLSRISLLTQYEAELMDMRRRLSERGRDENESRAVRSELTALRKALRLLGHDLSLGALELAIKGFRNDAATAEGFRRVVIFIGRRGIWWKAGEENHRVLHDLLESDRERRRAEGIEQKHYLWYRWNNGLLVLSGADSESAQDFELLKEWTSRPGNDFLILKALRRG